MLFSGKNFIIGVSLAAVSAIVLGVIIGWVIGSQQGNASRFAAPAAAVQQGAAAPQGTDGTGHGRSDPSIRDQQDLHARAPEAVRAGSVGARAHRPLGAVAVTRRLAAWLAAGSTRVESR